MNAAVQWDFIDHQPGVISARQDRVELAIHEAGHAVVAAMLGMAVPDHENITIGETETGSGGVTPIGHLQLAPGAGCGEHIVVFVAGNAAVETLMPGLVRSPDDETLAKVLTEIQQRIEATPPDEAFEANGNDDEMALAFLAFCYPHLTDDAVIEHYRDAEALARGWVATEPVCRAIQAVMTVLIHHSSISGFMVRQISERYGLISRGHA